MQCQSMPMVGKMSSNLRTTEFLKMQMEDSDIFNIFYLPNDFVGKTSLEKIIKYSGDFYSGKSRYFAVKPRIRKMAVNRLRVLVCCNPACVSQSDESARLCSAAATAVLLAVPFVFVLFGRTASRTDREKTTDG